LLHALLEIAPEFGASVAGVAHVNHKLRGQESEEDERFVRALATHHKLAFYTVIATVDASQNLEQSARRERREFFEGLISQGAASKIALGHTLDDQAETVLFRLLRGSGLAGLAGVHPVSANGLIRPLIGVTRVEIVKFLRERSIEWREDRSNADPRFARNRIRHQLLPQLAREWNPNLVQALAQLAELAFEEERAWAQTLPAPSASLSAKALREMPRAAARRVIRRAIQAAKGDLKRIEFQHVERVLDMKSKRAILPGVEVTKSAGRIEFAPSAAKPAPKRSRHAVLT
ncbi:MAG TPA: tRNA lysidine(34) synthetase TilS, partial [Bryobacteraceae bacterium]|nr:tRNA lysidine(34) synthetase TilS [Bryobacteraceae bacterium]